MIRNVPQVSALKSRYMIEGLISTPYIFLVHTLFRKCCAVSLLYFVSKRAVSRQGPTLIGARLEEMRVRIALTKARKELALDSFFFYLYVAISGWIIEYNLHT